MDAVGERNKRHHEQQQEQQDTNIEVTLTRNVVMLDGLQREDADFFSLMQEKLLNKVRDEDRVVIVKSEPNTPYSRWIKFTELIEQAGGIITIQTEEEVIIAQ